MMVSCRGMDDCSKTYVRDATSNIEASTLATNCRSAAMYCESRHHHRSDFMQVIQETGRKDDTIFLLSWCETQFEPFNAVAAREELQNDFIFWRKQLERAFLHSAGFLAFQRGIVSFVYCFGRPICEVVIASHCHHDDATCIAAGILRA